MPKIMLVEDDNNLREIYGERLMAEGYDIVSASDGEEALALAVKEKPDLIISDVMMPKISGFDMLDILRQTPETKSTKVIMMTALSQSEDKDRADRLGADKYLVKSQVTLEDVARVVHDLVYEPEASAEDETASATQNTPITPQDANVLPNANSVVPTFSTTSAEPPASPTTAPAAAPAPTVLPTPTVTYPQTNSMPAPEPILAPAEAIATEPVNTDTVATAPAPEPAIVAAPQQPVAPGPVATTAVPQQTTAPEPPVLTSAASTPTQPIANDPVLPVLPQAPEPTQPIVSTNNTNPPAAPTVSSPIAMNLSQIEESQPTPQAPQPEPQVSLPQVAPTTNITTTPQPIVNPITGEQTLTPTFEVPTVVSSADAQTSSDELAQIEEQLASFTNQAEPQEIAEHQAPLVEPSEQELIHAQNQLEEPAVVKAESLTANPTASVSEQQEKDPSIPEIIPNSDENDLEPAGARKKVIEPIQNGAAAAPSIYDLYEKEMAEEAANMAVQNPGAGGSITAASTSNPITTDTDVTNAPLETIDVTDIDGITVGDEPSQIQPPSSPTTTEQPIASQPAQAPSLNPNDPNSIAL